MSGVTLDTGALIAFERNDRQVVTLIQRALERREPVAVPAGVVGQAWRDGQRQARLARLLASPQIEVEPLDDMKARAAGQLCGVTRTRDIIDASVVLCARSRGQAVVTSDVGDLRRLDAKVRLVAV
jgi:hypothetical protein